MLFRSGKNAQSTALGAQHLRVFARYASPSSLRGVGRSHKPLQRYNTSAPFVGQTLPIMKGIFANYLAMSKNSCIFAFVYSGNDDA